MSKLRRRHTKEPCTLSDRVGSGGEGDIWLVRESDALVAKIYHEPSKISARKLELMLATPPVDPMAARGHHSIAWPVDHIEETPSGRLVGFLMPRLDRMLPVHQLYNMQARLAACPDFNYRYLYTAAANITSAVAAIHDKQYVIGDVNESNILVTRGALASLVDCDSFQVRDPPRATLRCTVRSVGFTPPELLGKDLGAIDRVTEHDLFGLGVLVFQLLMEGFHPFRARYLLPGDPPELEARIGSGLFPHGAGAAHGVAAPPGALDFAVAPRAIVSLFERCFVDGQRDPSRRPSAKEWLEALRKTAAVLRKCSTVTTHFFPPHLRDCPWCARAVLLRQDPFPVAGPSRPTTGTRPGARPPTATPAAGPTTPRPRPVWPTTPPPPGPAPKVRRPRAKLVRNSAVALGLVVLAILGWAMAMRGGGISGSDLVAAVVPPLELYPPLPSAPEVPGFTPLGKSSQGYDEYRHERTGVIFVLLPGGSFEMGSPASEAERGSDEGPVHRVTLDPFLIAKHELSQQVWEAVMGANPSRFRGPQRPVENVSWDDIQRFEAKTGLTLPTEAQWEYACRAGTSTPFSFGATITADIVNYNGNYPYGGASNGRYRKETVDVGALRPNGFGLHAMHGNVLEWCEDVYDSEFYDKPEAKQPNPLCVGGSESRVLRGGSWGHYAGYCRSARRLWRASGDRYEKFGFRPSFQLSPLESFTASPLPASAGDEAARSASAVAVPASTRRAIAGFARLATNPQGYDEYRHERTGVIFVLLPGGSFDMGSPASEADSSDDERPVHRVTLDPFLIAKHELSQQVWEAVMGANPSRFRGPQRPVDNVSWDDIQQFEAKTGLTLPTEAQWEYACRAGTSTPFSFGATITADIVNYDGNYPYGGAPLGRYRKETDDVGSLPPNGFGLHAMHGNVLEWCEDVYDSEFYGKPEATQPNPVCVGGSGVRVLRGGSWYSYAWYCRSANRDWFASGYRFERFGFRPSFAPLR